MPTPTTAPVDATDPAQWIIDGGGIGPIRRGAALPTAAGALGPYEEVESNCPNPNVRSFRAAASTPSLMTVTRDDGTAVEWVTVSAWGPSAGTLDSPSTENGVLLGTERADLEAAYPGLQPTAYGDTLFFGTPSAGGWVVFTVQGDLVVAITSSPDATIPREFCG